MQSKKLWFIHVFAGYNFKQNDFYEPRTLGWFFKRGGITDFNVYFESNDSKKYTYMIDLETYSGIHFYNYFSNDLEFEQSMRFNNKFSLTQSIKFIPAHNDVGYVYVDSSVNINFAKRNVNTIENILSAKYSFSNVMYITCRLRHYISSVDNKDFYLLQHDGTLAANAGYHPEVNQNANFLNVDMVYTWQFGPGSFLNIVWKDAAQDNTNIVQPQYFKNLSHSITENSNNNFSLKVIYFLDYLKLKNDLHKNQL